MDNYSYPAGADTREAPWNQRDKDMIERYVDVSVTLMKKVILHTSDYFTETDTNGDDVEEIHTVCAFHDWEPEYENECYTIPEMLEELKRYIESELPLSTGKRRFRLLGMLNDCQGWTKEDFNAEED